MSDYIFERVRKVKQKYGTSDPFQLLRDMGATVKFTDAFSRDGLRGFCTILNGFSYVVINQKQPEEEQRVVAAHEAGHLILHSDTLRCMAALQDFDLFLATGRLEHQANCFAADFLMEDGEILDLIQGRDLDFFETARALSVPAPFLAFKLHSMIRRGYDLRLPVDLNPSFLRLSGDRFF